MFRNILNIFLIAMMLLATTGCSTKHKKKHAKPPVVWDKSKQVKPVVKPSGSKVYENEHLKDRVQKAYLYDHDKQMGLLFDAQAYMYKHFEYTYDSKAFGKDHWTGDIIRKMLRDRAQKAKGDCEDFAFAGATKMITGGFPADQIHYTFCMVPGSTKAVTGVSAEWGGHMVLIVEIEGETPYILEQRPTPHHLSEMMDTYKYFFVGTQRADLPMGNFTWISHAGFNILMESKNYYDSTFTGGYMKFTEYANKVYTRHDFEEE